MNACLHGRISLGKISSLEVEISSSGDSTAALGHLFWSLITSQFPLYINGPFLPQTLSLVVPVGLVPLRALSYSGGNLDRLNKA